jgi:N-acetylated-alpha-linked acidic dipeptidase
VFGATDPLSGTVAQLSEAKAIGQLVKAGWRPRRTLVYASWDGEEPGLLGSTEWAETHAAELQAKAALYINTDDNERGFFRAEGTHGLQRFVSEAARDVKDPETDASVLTRALAERRVQAFEAGRETQGHQTEESGNDLHLGPLGSGSDFTPFLQHLGVTSLDLAFSGESQYGVYHSAYDSFDHFRRFVDPSFAYEATLAKVAGRIALRASEAELLPLRAGDFARSVAAYDEELHQLTDHMRAKTLAQGKLLDSGAFALAGDPLVARAAPQRDADVPYLTFTTLDNAVEALERSSDAFDQVYARECNAQDAGAPARRERLNAVLTVLEARLTDSRGLPRREWYRHMIYAPGLQTGYEAKTLPAIREALEERHWDEANEYVVVVADRLNAYRDALDQAVAASSVIATP